MQKKLRLFSLFILSSIFSIGLFAQPEADFFFELPENPNKLVAPVQVDFVNVALGENLDYTWMINGEAFSIEEEPQQLFAEAGTFNVCLEVKNEAGKDLICQTLEFFDSIHETGIISVSNK